MLGAIAVLGVLAGGLAFWLWDWPSVISTTVSILCLALGFWITEMLVGIFTRVKKANASAIVMLFLGKIAWWATLFAGAKRLPPGHDGAVGLGIGTFLLALLFATLKHYGMPRISDVETPRDP